MALIAITFLVYFPTLFNDFCLDDAIILTVVPHLEIGNLLIEPIAHRTILHFRPLTFLSFAIDYTLWGKNPLGFHLSNIFLAALTVIFVFSCCKCLFSASQAFIIASLFAVLPCHSEAVISPYNRSQILSTLFILIVIFYFIPIYQKNKFLYKNTIIAAIALFLGALSKETALVAPALVVLLYFYAPKCHFRYLGFFLLGQITAIVCYFGLRFYVLGTWKMPGVDAVFAEVSLLERYFNICAIFTQYLRLSFFPVLLSCDYSLKNVAFHFGAFIYPVLLTIALFCIYKKNSYKNIALGFLWFLVTLLPVLHLVPLQIFIAERFLYPASIGTAIILSLFWIQNKRCLIVIWLLMATLTINRCFDWRNNETLWKNVLTTHPQSFRAKIFMGSLASRQKKFQKAFALYQQALLDNPNLQNKLLIYYNQARIYFFHKNYQQTNRLLEKILALDSKYAPAWELKGDIAYHNQKWQRALRFYQKSRNSKWGNTQKLIRYMGNCFLVLENWEKAYQCYLEVEKNFRKDHTFYTNLGYVALQKKAYKEAHLYFNTALKLYPKSFRLHYLFSKYFFVLSKPEQGLFHYQKAKELLPVGMKLPPMGK